MRAEDGAPNVIDSSNSFSLHSARLYLSGSASETVNFTLNTERKGCVFGSQDGAGSGGDVANRPQDEDAARRAAGGQRAQRQFPREAVCRLVESFIVTAGMLEAA